ncbi:MAG: hypothetical protein KBA86_01400 [Bacteroidales bacterium]|nr:hypothetical protein [Bacteroidales bacterium]
MKKQLLTLFFLAFIPVCLMAHAPKKVVVSYDAATSTVKVIVTHPVSNVNTHFVQSIVITVDGKEVKTFNETKQENATTETVEVVLSGVKPGMTIEAVAKCNLMGSKKGKIAVK